MPCFIVSYDVKEGGDYEPLYAALRSYGTWARIALSTWAIVADKSATEVRDHLLTFMGPEDRLFVVKSGVAAAWRNVRCRGEWLKENL